MTRLVTSAALVPSASSFVAESAAGPGTVRALYEGFEPGVQAQAETGVRAAGAPGFPRAVCGAPVLSDAWPDDVGACRRWPRRCASSWRTRRPNWRRRSGQRGRPVSARGPWARRDRLTFVDVDVAQAEAFARGASSACGRSPSKRRRHAVVVNAPPEMKRTVDVWGPAGDTLALMRRVKERFDPTRTDGPRPLRRRDLSAMTVGAFDFHDPPSRGR